MDKKANPRACWGPFASPMQTAALWGEIKVDLVAVNDPRSSQLMQRLWRNRRKQTERGGPKLSMREASFRPHSLR